MTTYIEVLDTAVKIGLGAAITGATTYIVTRVKGKQDSQIEAEKYSRSLFERISLGFEESASTLAKVILLLSNLGSEPPDVREWRISEAKALRVKWYEQIDRAEALATLVGTTALQDKLRSYTDLAADLLETSVTRLEDIDELNRQVDDVNSARENVRRAIRSAFDERAS